MKTSLKLFLASLVLLTQGFAQEPKQALAKQGLAKQISFGQPQMERAVSGAPLLPAPVVQPKALPPLNPSLGEIARRARAAHSTAPKAQVVVETDTAAQKTDHAETTAATTNQTTPTQE